MRPSELVPTARETWNGVRVVMDEVIKEQPPPAVPIECLDTQVIRKKKRMFGKGHVDTTFRFNNTSKTDCYFLHFIVNSSSN